MQQFIQRLLGQAKPVAIPRAAEPRVLNAHEARAVAGGPQIRNNGV